MRISDWSSDVCSSDLVARAVQAFDGDALAAEEIGQLAQDARLVRRHHLDDVGQQVGLNGLRPGAVTDQLQDRKSVVMGKSVSVRVDIGGRRLLQKKQTRLDLTIQYI